MKKAAFYLLLAGSIVSAQEAVSISGTVTDQGGVPLSGVIVKLLTAQIADTTGADGIYSLSGQALPVIGRVPSDRAFQVRYRNARFIFLAEKETEAAITLYDFSGRHLAAVYNGILRQGKTEVPFSLEERGRMFLVAVRHGGKQIAFKLVRSGMGAFSVFPGPEAAGPLAKAAGVDWLQAAKAGYATHAEELSAYTGTVDIVLRPLGAAPDFGPNVYIYDDGMDMNVMETEINTIGDAQEDRANEFGPNRFALFFKPGTYTLDVHVGYYMQVAGLGLMPDDVQITGAVQSREVRSTALSNFWRSTENLAITPEGGTNYWIVSQAAPFRRIHVKGNLGLSKGGYTSGGFLADSKIDGNVSSGTQQQFFSRNSNWTQWNGGVWNMMFLGVINPPTGAWPSSPNTVVGQTPLVREKPFLYIDGDGKYNVFVPALRTNTQGTSWESGSAAGESLPIDLFHIAREGIDNAASINAALTAGKNLLFTPGKYSLEQSINVSRPGTVVLGLGYASLMPLNGTPAMTTADVDGIIVAGITFDAGSVNSPALLMVGPAGSSADHSANPVILSDLFCRVGTTQAGMASSCVTINSHDVVADHFWLWRADHGPSAVGRPGWDVDVSPNGLVVNGDNVTIYGLFNEHFQEFQTLWNGNGGRTYFYQCEMPYDPPSQVAWSHDGIDGYAAYKVSDGVTSHEAWGLGIYCVFWDAAVWSENAIEVPDVPGVSMHHMVTFWLNGNGGGIRHVINGTGGPSEQGNQKGVVDEYP